MTSDELDNIQSALEVSRRRQLTEAATRDDFTSLPTELVASHLVVLKSLTCEMRALLDEVAEQTLMSFGRRLGELRMTFPR
jgi:hypothetical protein